VQPSTSLAADEASSLAAALMGPSMPEACSLAAALMGPSMPEACSLAAALMGPSMPEASSLAASLIPTATMTAGRTGRARSTAQEARSWRTGGKGGRIKVFTY